MPRIEVFSDFDGTISIEDTGCVLIDTGMGTLKRKEMDKKIMNHEMTFLEAMEIWWGGVSLTYEEGLDLLRTVPLDPGFLHFHSYILKHDIPFSIVSCGLDILIKDFMSWYLGQEQADQLIILANYARVEDRRWLVTYKDDSPHSHDKSVCIRESKQEFKRQQVERQKKAEMAGETADQQAEEHVVVFCGDGISDLSAAREADVLFARSGRDLEKYCRTHKIPFTPFDSFDKVTELIQGLQDGSLTMAEIQRRQQQECETPL